MPPRLVQTAGGFFILQLLLLLISVSQADLFITDTSGRPVTGASICTDNTLIGISDSRGEVSLPDGTDSVEVRALGYETWEGAIPPSGDIFLTAVPVPSGMVISVTASRGGFRDRFPATTVLDRDDMESLGRSGLRSLSSRSGGIYVREYGGAMPVISIAVRGSDAAHSEYYVDGHDISSSMDGLPGMTLDPVLFGGLEVSRGGGSGFLKGGMAGTLNFIPESSGLPARASLSAGDDKSISLSGGFTAGISRIALSIRKLAGISGSTAHDGAILIHGNAYPFTYGLLAAVSSGETESPDWTLPTDGVRKRYSLDAWGRWSPGGLRLSLGMRTGRHEYASTVPSMVDDTHNELGGDLTLEYNLPLLPFHLGLSANTSLDRVSSTSIGARDRLTGETALTAGYGDGLSISASASLNTVSSAGTMHGAVLSMGLPVLDSLLLLHASASTGFRRPSLNDLYWPEDIFARGNPDLLPETSLEFEGGISFNTFEWFALSATGFIAETDDLIRWEPGEGGKWSPVNIARVLRKGLETEVWFSDNPIEITGTLTLLDVTDNFIESVNYGRILPYTPDYTFGLQAGLEFPRWAHWSVSASGMGIRFKNYSETSWMPAYTIITAGVDLHPEFMGDFSVNTSIENLLNEEYQETSGYSGKPRTLYFGIKWNGN
ncbi:MAG: TonB-dependent receptor [Candidatus Aegiribacteria sp.]|nr:TonB-dependent receptor [Candidatus Aegiribacteria sp.]